MIRTVIIEDQPLAAQPLATLLDDTRHVDVIGTAADGATGLRLCIDIPDHLSCSMILLPVYLGAFGSERSFVTKQANSDSVYGSQDKNGRSLK